MNTNYTFTILFLALLKWTYFFYDQSRHGPILEKKIRRIKLFISNIREKKHREADLGRFLDGIVNALDAGLTLGQGFELAKNRVKYQGHLSESLQKVQQAKCTGMGFTDIFFNMSRNEKTDHSVKLMWQTLAWGSKSGAKLNICLRALIKRLETMQTLRMKLRSATAQMRFQAMCMSLLPLLMGIFLKFVKPDSIEFFFNTSTGHMLLCYMVISNFIGGYFVYYNSLKSVDK